MVKFACFKLAKLVQLNNSHKFWGDSGCFNIVTFRLKCQKYGIVYNHLVFINKEGSKDVKVKRRFVVRVGEVYSILASVHEKIGHLGMKRT